MQQVAIEAKRRNDTAARKSGGETSPSLLDGYMSECRSLVLTELRRRLPKSGRCQSALYDLILEYPLREAKALRPTLCIATARALGGSLEAVVPTATVLELYHNAFLIHDDVEDDSDRRRDGATLHRRFGVPVAMNVGDAMLAMAFKPLLDNPELIGLGKALRVLQVVSRMAWESAEGQALELAWCRERRWDLGALDYFRMVRKKTSHYTFIAPVEAGAIVGGADADTLRLLRRFAASMGAAFQIQDDVLNLTSGPKSYGKDARGDLWEGKHTLIVLHMLGRATKSERAAAMDALSRPRAVREPGSGPRSRTQADVDLLFHLIEKHQSIDHAQGVAQKWAKRAEQDLRLLEKRLRASVHRDVLETLAAFVIHRDH